jgi:hypothetical protein
MKTLLVIAAALAFLQPLLAKTPLILGAEENRTGLKQITNAGNLSPRSVWEREFTEKLEDGTEVEFLLRLPTTAGTPVTRVNAIVFIAPYPREKFRTARSLFANALVVRGGCAVVSLIGNNTKRDPTYYYIFPRAGYVSLAETVLDRIKKEYGEPNTPVIAAGYSDGGVMAMYLAQSKAIKFSAAIAFEQSQNEESTPRQYDLDVPTLVINPENSPWNSRIARRCADATAASKPLQLCIARPVIDLSTPQAYYRKAGGRYANDLAYCFIRDVVEATALGQWPDNWRRKEIQIDGLLESRSLSVFSSGPDYDNLYKLLSHNEFEAVAPGHYVYSALPPFFRQQALIVLKKGVWNHQDQVMLAALSIHRGCAVTICGIPDAGTLVSSVQAQIQRLKALGLPITVAAVCDEADEEWSSQLGALPDDVRCVKIFKGKTLALPETLSARATVHLTVPTDFPVWPSHAGGVTSEPIWFTPSEFDQLLQRIVPTAQKPPDAKTQK